MARLGSYVGDAIQGAIKSTKMGRGVGSGVGKSSYVSNRLGMGGDEGFMGRAAKTASWGFNNAMASAGGTGMGLAKAIGGHALRGGVAGGLAGGAIEASQGGSFWTGAKEGAFNGAVGWGAWRTAGRMAGATTRNPLRAMGNQGVVGSTANMYRATGPNVSKQASAILNQKQMAGLARMTMNGNR